MFKKHFCQIADKFWKDSGITDQWPYDIEKAILSTTLLNIYSLNNLSFVQISEWFKFRGIQINFGVDGRELHGFITIYRDLGFIFINGTDSMGERRYTLAHEFAHYLLDYKIPREKAIDAFGESIKDVLDGYRPPTTEERISSIFSSISIRPFYHLMERTGSGVFENSHKWIAENDADELAILLLAPYDLVYKDVVSEFNYEKNYRKYNDFIQVILKEKYLIPQHLAEIYSPKYAYSFTGGPTVLEKLGIQ